MKLQKLFASRPQINSGRRLYVEAVAQARQPVFYRDWTVPDTADGRFELYSLHVILLLHRLKHGGQAAEETAQGLFDGYVKALDDSMREAGIGDLSVGNKVRKLGSAFMGRIKAYDGTLADEAALRPVVGRILFEGDEMRAAPLAAYAAAATARLAAEPLETLMEGRAVWPEVTP